MISQALPHLTAWTNALLSADIPVLATTVLHVAELRQIEEAKGTVDAQTLAQSIGNDPLMTLKVLSHVSRYCTRLSVEPPETLTGAIVMLGINPFFKDFSDIENVDHWLRDKPQAMMGLHRVIRRSRRAAHFAVHFAMHRQDEDASIIQEAALLHSFGELLLWCHAPDLMHVIAEKLAHDHTLRSADVQREILGIEVGDLSQNLMRAWQLPYLLIRCTDDRHAEHPQVRTVMLAVRIARHTQYGWDSANAQAALPDDIDDVAQLLNISSEAASRKIRDMDH
ncbi:MAG TPA: HDOD domain-containing protein [Aquabacterium sp.]|uniref:HDOD domain-containing protein n=1 Tax=Aquabacterium sp. TaxID=1872578 RepID=UPI002E375A57|nr:HDOD domain-containing protein [Aquabacterium sp.]HEX5371417.1 HDOD domain-containing protein [Aquabacterium sp.]